MNNWKQSRAARLEAHAKEVRRSFHATRPGLRPGDPYKLDPYSMPKELWGAYHPKEGLIMLPWFLNRGIVEEWLTLEMPNVRGRKNTDAAEWAISGPWTVGSPPISDPKEST